MRILALDLSTHTGWAVMTGDLTHPPAQAYPKLIDHGIIEVKPAEGVAYPFTYIFMAKHLARQVETLIERFKPDGIAIEETNQGKAQQSRYHQKMLEFIHYAVGDMLLATNLQPKYMNTSEWQRWVGLKLSKDQRARNAAVKADRDRQREALRERITAAVMAMPRMDLTPRQLTAWRKKEIKERLSTAWRSVRVYDASGTVAGKTTNKHLAVDTVNRIYGLGLIKKDHDVCDAILLGAGYYRWVTQQKEPG